MSTKNNTGVRNHNPNMAPAGTGSEVAINPPAVVPSVATPPVTAPTTVSTASAMLMVETAAKSFREGYANLLAALLPAIDAVHSAGTVRTTAASGQRKQSAALYAELLRQHPDITASVTSDEIDAGLAANAALAMVRGDLRQSLPVVESCGRDAGSIACTKAAVVRSAARTLARTDRVLAAKIASIDVILRRGKLVSTTADSAAKAQASATKTQQRAAAEAAKAQAKAARAARVATRTAQAHADNHPTTPDVVIVPAGTTDPTGTTPKG